LVFSEIVRSHRQRLGVTQEELATLAGVSVRSIREIEAGRTGRPRPGTVRLLAEAFALVGTERDRFSAAAASDQGPPAPLGTRLGEPAPRQLPAAVPGFAGREQHLRRLDALAFEADSGDGPATALVITAIDGMAGVGKTALAVHWAHRVADRFPDGQLYVNLRGFDPTGTVVSAAEAIRGFLDAFQVPAQRVPVGLDAQAALYRSLLAGRRMLIVLDNARDAEHVRPLLPGTPGCLVVVTSRNQLTGLVAAEGAHPLALDVLDPAGARELLTRRLGARRVAAEPEAVQEIIDRCARLPLTLALAAARAAARPQVPLTALAKQLRATGGALAAFAVDDPATDVRAVFSWSYRTLTPEAARLFRVLGLHPGPDISAPAAASLAGIPVARVDALLAELTRAHVLAEDSPGRYTFHDLLRAYATDRAYAEDSADHREEALQRILDHYLHSAYAAAQVFDPYRDPITLVAPQPGVTPERVVDAGEAFAWFTAELPTLMAAVHQSAAVGFDAHTWQLVWSMADFLDRRGHWYDWVTLQSAALDAASRLGDVRGQAYGHRGLGLAYVELRRFEEALAEHLQAVELYRRLDDDAGTARAYLNVARAYDHLGRNADALHNAERALDLYRKAGVPAGEARALNSVGWYHGQLGHHQQALTFCQQALDLLEELGDRYAQAYTLDSVGFAHHHLGNYPEAITAYRRALDLNQDLHDRRFEADTLNDLGDTYRAAGRADAARDAWKRAAEILDELGHANADMVRAKINQ
jgi:tetratricopeptide (TPR) repeat protein/transcriptional regulator with XRE-family HTH domain